MVVRRRLLRRRGVDHGGPVAPRSARCIRRGAGRRRHTATARAALDAARRRCSCRCPAGGHGDGDLAGDDGRRHGDDTGSPQAARPRGRQPVRGVTPHRRHVRASAPLSGASATAAGGPPPSPAPRCLSQRHRCRRCPATSSSSLFPSLWLLGIGWNFGLIGGSSLLIESVPAAQRAAVQGSADLAMSFCGGLAGFSSGFIRRAVGFHILATLATVAAGLLLVAAASARSRSDRPLASYRRAPHRTDQPHTRPHPSGGTDGCDDRTRPGLRRPARPCRVLDKARLPATPAPPAATSCSSPPTARRPSCCSKRSPNRRQPRTGCTSTSRPPTSTPKSPVLRPRRPPPRSRGATRAWDDVGRPGRPRGQRVLRLRRWQRTDLTRDVDPATSKP